MKNEGLESTVCMIDGCKYIAGIKFILSKNGNPDIVKYSCGMHDILTFKRMSQLCLEEGYKLIVDYNKGGQK